MSALRCRVHVCTHVGIVHTENWLGWQLCFGMQVCFFLYKKSIYFKAKHRIYRSSNSSIKKNHDFTSDHPKPSIHQSSPPRAAVDVHHTTLTPVELNRNHDPGHRIVCQITVPARPSKIHGRQSLIYIPKNARGQHTISPRARLAQISPGSPRGS